METNCSCNKASLGAQIRIGESAGVGNLCLECLCVCMCMHMSGLLYSHVRFSENLCVCVFMYVCAPPWSWSL